jgi:hypothetical protein
MVRARLKRIGLGDDVARVRRALSARYVTAVDRAIAVDNALDASTRTVIVFDMSPAHFALDDREFTKSTKKYDRMDAN